MTYYKKIKTIQKSLFKNNVPEDLFDFIFEYYGDPQESVDDLHNKHCFYQINCSSLVRPIRGYFCHACGVFLEVKSAKQLYRHCKCFEHQANLPFYNKHREKLSDIKEIKEICCSKWFSGVSKSPQSQKYKQNFIDDLNPIPVVINFDRNEIKLRNI